MLPDQEVVAILTSKLASVLSLESCLPELLLKVEVDELWHIFYYLLVGSKDWADLLFLPLRKGGLEVGQVGSW